jgi:hypothetical protein
VTNYQDYPPGRRRILRSGRLAKHLTREKLTLTDLTWHGHQIHQPIELDELIAQCNLEGPTSSGYFERAAGPFTVFCVRAGIPQSILDTSNSSNDDNHLTRELWHHYITYTATNMMPFQDNRNPWLSIYPRIACQRSTKGRKSSLQSAILAQAAGNLAQLGSRREEMSRLARNFYADGVRDLRTSLESMEFSTILASIGTLMMVEVFNLTQLIS